MNEGKIAAVRTKQMGAAQVQGETDVLSGDDWKACLRPGGYF